MMDIDQSRDKQAVPLAKVVPTYGNSMKMVRLSQ